MNQERESKALARALAPYRTGAQGKLRAQVRCMLVRLMGFAECEEIPVGTKIPHRFPGRSGLSEDEMRDMIAIAYDGLLELGYEAAAYELTDRGRDPYFLDARPSYLVRNFDYRAKNALENLETGPPSILIDGHPIVTRTLRRFDLGDAGQSYVVGRNVNDPTWWYRFVRGRAVHNQRGEWVGWDNEAGYTFQRRGRTLEDVLSGKYGSVDLR